MKRFSLNVPDELHRRFKVACSLEGISMTDILLRLVENYVREVERRKLIPLARKK